ncbi:glycosyltransferase family 4 protein [uncultured Dokdonia sp.]|uniref:glycosyltransferase family 4 protein n=1 Tax=uncultured Dokdonia sp. TaxID=575653 RepID=UPI0026203208|nr:glycosyltransferase family 4 protein [uncultured Dokdonia sp.]
MRFLVITLAPTLLENSAYYSYAPYVKEMNLWFSHVDQVTIISPTSYEKKLLKAPFDRKDIDVISIPAISFGTITAIFKSIIAIPIIVFRLFKAMQQADHIHLRCPATIALIASVVQLFFPSKKKTVKYAGNWSPKAKQPISYKLQKWIVGNEFLTRNMQVLVYGNWPNQSKNIKSFFTATYRDDDVPTIKTPIFENPITILFVGSLSPGKRPLYVLEWAKACLDQDLDIHLDIYGEGQERELLEKYLTSHKLHTKVILHGNQPTEVVQQAYKNAHFLILPSKSEGWPKVIAEAMFWGVIPLVTPISCVPWMVGEGTRGVLLDMDVSKDVSAFAKALKDKKQLEKMAVNGQQWSHQYTLDTFENSIKELL